MPVSKIGTNALSSGLDVSSTNISYTGTLTGGTGVVNIGSGQVYKDASGNVGIGTSSPQRRLEVSDSTDAQVRFTGQSSANGARLLGYSNSDAVSFGVGGSTGGQQGAATAYIGSLTNVPLVFTTNGSDRARIDSNGNLLVGTTSGSNARLYVVADGGLVTPFIVNNTAAGTGASTSAVWRRNGTTVGSIDVTGSTTAYNTSSDYRLKHDITPMTGALAKVALLKPVTYKWNVDDGEGEGFIAHELAEVVPQCVTGEKDAVDADGNPKYQGIDTSFLVATLTAAIQELKAELDSVKAELAVLKGV